MSKVWRANHVTIKVDAAADVSIDTNNELSSFFGSATAITGYCKSVEITPPEGPVDKIDLLGETSNFQNAELHEKPFGLAKMTGTLLMQGDEIFETYYGGAGTSLTSASYTRYQYGSSESGKTRADIAIVAYLDDGTDAVEVCLDNAKITKLSPRRISGADGHWEQDFEIICLAKDYREDIKD